MTVKEWFAAYRGKSSFRERNRLYNITGLNYLFQITMLIKTIRQDLNGQNNRHYGLEDYKRYLKYSKFHKPNAIIWKMKYKRQIADLVYMLRSTLSNY